MKHPIIVDVLAAYTSAAADMEMFDEGIRRHIVNMFSIANDVYANSNTNVQLQLVGPVVTSYEESGDIELDLTRLHDPHDGRMDDLLSTRDSMPPISSRSSPARIPAKPVPAAMTTSAGWPTNISRRSETMTAWHSA